MPMVPVVHGPSPVDGSHAFSFGGLRSPFALLLTLRLLFRYHRQGKSTAAEMPILLVVIIFLLLNKGSRLVTHSPFFIDISKLL